MAAKVLIIYETRRKYKHFNSNRSYSYGFLSDIYQK